MNQFLEGVDGSTTAVIIAKDLCSNLDTSKQVTEGVKNGIDCLLSQILQYYKTFYRPCDPVGLSPSPMAPPPVSPAPLLHTSSSYSSFYQYTRSYSLNDMNQLLDSREFSVDPEGSVTTEPPSSSWSSFLSSLFTSLGSLTSLKAGHALHRGSTMGLNQSKLPPSLRSLPLYLYYLRRGCLFGDCFHNQDLLQLRRLQIASASLQDSMRIILPRLILARDPTQPVLHSHSSSSQMMSPPPSTSVQKTSSLFTRGHRRGNSRLSGVASLPLLTSRAVSMPDLSALHSEVELKKPPVKLPDKKECVEIKKKDEEPFSYAAFVAEEVGEGSEYYMPSQWLQCSPSAVQPLYSVLSPESLALLSDAVVVLDTQREIFIWVGSERAELKEDDVFGHCLSVALSITQERNPPSVIRVVKEFTSNSRHVLCNLIPSHKDPLDIAMKSLTVLSTVPAGLLRDHVGKFLYTDDMSFREYMTKIYHFR